MCPVWISEHAAVCGCMPSFRAAGRGQFVGGVEAVNEGLNGALLQNIAHIKGTDPKEKEKEKEKERERERERDRERAVAAAAKLQLQQAGIKYALLLRPCSLDTSQHCGAQAAPLRSASEVMYVYAETC